MGLEWASGKFDIEDLAQQSVLIATDFVSKCDDYLKRR